MLKAGTSNAGSKMEQNQALTGTSSAASGVASGLVRTGQDTRGCEVGYYFAEGCKVTDEHV